MTKKEAQRALAENLMLLAEALMDDDESGEYNSTSNGGELKITSVLGNSTTVIAVKNWNYDKLDDDNEWAEYID